MDHKAPASSGSSDAGSDSSSNTHYSTTVPVNTRVRTTARIKGYIVHVEVRELDEGYVSVRVRPKDTFPRSSFKFTSWATLEVQEMGPNPHKTLTISASLDPAGPERDCEEITVRLKVNSTVAPVDSDYSSNDESVGRLKLE